MRKQEAQLKEGVYQVAAQNAGSVHFETLYRIAYKMVLHKRGDVARDMVIELLRKCSLVQSRDKYDLLVRMMASIFQYSERVWVPKTGATPLPVAAIALHERPVAAHWRRLRRAVKWVALTSLVLRDLHKRATEK